MGHGGLVLFARVLYLAVLVCPREWESTRRNIVLGAYVFTMAPILFTGFWTQAPVFWLSLAIVSRLGSLEVPLGGTKEPTPATQKAPRPLTV